MIDLHAHSTASDGTLTPTELVQLAKSEGLTAIALTDHDTVAGLDEAKAEADRQGIVFVPGIELEVDWTPGAFHMLGLGLKEWNGPTRTRLERVRKLRKERNLKMVALMQAAGMPVTYEELSEIAGHDTVGRPHFARLFIEKGLVSSYQEAFDKLIGDGKPYYVRKKTLGVGPSCAAIHASGGLAVIAHPQSLQLNWDEMARQFHRWKHEGLDGVEAYHSNMTIREGHRFAALAAEVGLLTTAGSDYHGPHRTGVRLGRTCGRMKIDDRFLEPFLE